MTNLFETIAEGDYDIDSARVPTADPDSNFVHSMYCQQCFVLESAFFYTFDQDIARLRLCHIRNVQASVPNFVRRIIR